MRLFANIQYLLDGYDILPTSASSCFSTDSYEAFKYSLHTGSLSIALDHLRQFFDQRFNEGRQPPRQHMLNAMLWALLEAENVQGGMEVGPFCVPAGLADFGVGPDRLPTKLLI